MTYRWKFLKKQGRAIVSNHGNLKWKIGEWQHVDGDIVACENGLHASKKVYEAFSYIQGEILAKVEVKGKKDEQDDKAAYSDMRIVEAYKWTKKDSVALSIFAAELCLKEFEKLYPKDKRPRNAIEAARAVLTHDTAKNRSAAWSARSAAWSARSAAESAWSAARSAAWSAARSAAWSARSAAWSAWSASESAWSAAESAESAARSAAWSARSAARSAAESAAIKKIAKWMNDRVKELERCY
jgi:hypothetical protein